MLSIKKIDKTERIKEMESEGKFSLTEIIKIQEALKPLAYEIRGYKKRDRPERITINLVPIQDSYVIPLGDNPR
jgi:hypothetical protein